LSILFLTKSGSRFFLFGPLWNLIVSFLGNIMDIIFRALSSMGVVNIGVCIILFTIVTRILMFPMSYNQAKSQKLMSVVQPEVQAIQAKYKGKERDQNAMMRQNAEIKAVYEKYGTSMTGGCLQMVIQMPIIFALYRVIINIPAYVASVKFYFQNIVDAIGGTAAVERVNAFAHSSESLTKVLSNARISGGNIQTTDNIIDFLYHLNPSQWDLFKNAFSEASGAIAANYPIIEQMNNFMGINLSSAPSSYGLLSVKAWIIPVLAGVSQFLATKLMTRDTMAMTQDENNPMGAMGGMMKNMNYMMPLMSVVFCFSFAAGIGVYWVASSLIMGVQQYFINRHMDKIDMDEMIKKNIAKANEKRARKGLPPINEKATEDNLKKMKMKTEREEQKRQQIIEEAKERQTKSNDYYKLDSIADRARMVQQYNDRKKK